jgi:hypothetical protein
MSDEKSPKYLKASYKDATHVRILSDEYTDLKKGRVYEIQETREKTNEIMVEDDLGDDHYLTRSVKDIRLLKLAKPAATPLVGSSMDAASVAAAKTIKKVRALVDMDKDGQCIDLGSTYEVIGIFQSDSWLAYHLRDPNCVIVNTGDAIFEDVLAEETIDLKGSTLILTSLTAGAKEIVGPGNVAKIVPNGLIHMTFQVVKPGEMPPQGEFKREVLEYHIAKE